MFIDTRRQIKRALSSRSSDSMTRGRGENDGNLLPVTQDFSFAVKKKKGQFQDFSGVVVEDTEQIRGALSTKLASQSTPESRTHPATKSCEINSPTNIYISCHLYSPPCICFCCAHTYITTIPLLQPPTPAQLIKNRNSRSYETIA